MNDSFNPRIPSSGEPMEESTLIQRLVPSYGTPNPFSFGGGLRNGGLSPEAMKMLPFDFDYMGSAEFEFGAVPNALKSLAATKKLVAGSIKFTEKQVKPIEDYMYKKLKDKPRPTFPLEHDTVYYICKADQEEEVIKRIKKDALGKLELRKARTLLPEVMRPNKSEPLFRFCGWLELDNGFFYFINKIMFEETCKLFGVENERTS